MQEDLLHSNAGKQWEQVDITHRHGINVPLFSLHSKQSCGIGEYTDLIPLISWVRSLGFDIIQLLPLNDPGNDSSPYSAISAFALNPIHIGLARLPYLMNYPHLQKQISEMQQLNATQRVDYPRVNALKKQFLKEYFSLVGPRIIESEEYKNFVNQHPWLIGYALFKAIKIERNWQSWEEWEEELRDPVSNSISFHRLTKQWEPEIAFHIFLQYLCFMQMKAAKSYADQQGIFLKGDIPILISRESADVWLNRRLFMTEFSAGSPPDMYSETGQNWGFPPYNWSELDKDNNSWWKQRLKTAGEFYHMYRLDHVVGFFRIWSIPRGKQGFEGYYIPGDESVWLSQGTRLMKMMLQFSPMLPIVEDLGNVPPIVRETLKNLGISGTKVMRWERYWDQDRSFIPYDRYISASMTTVSTHDSEPLQLWWKNNPDDAREFSEFMGWLYEEQLSSEHHRQILYASHHTTSIFHINLLQEYLFLIPGMTWSNLEDERINVPGVVSDRNWSYRLHPSIEQLIESDPLRQLMQNLIK